MTADQGGSERFRLGVNHWPADVAMDWLVRYDPVATRNDFARIAGAGMDTVRVFVRWDDLQPSPDRIDGVESLSAAFIDFNMPEEDGLELAARLRARRADLPIAIVSANAQTDVLERARSLGAVFLEKPVSRDALADFVAGTPAQRRSA